MCMLGCAAERPPEPIFPNPEAKESHKASDDDEVGQEKAIVDDPRIVARAERVRVLQNDTLGCPSEVMGLVDIHQPVDSVDRALAILKRKAAYVGADAVIGVEFHHGEPTEEPTHLSGLAVRCNDLIKGRAYDVLERIEVQGKMGKEDDAEKELMARAGALGADLIINIGFEHEKAGSNPPKSGARRSDSSDTHMRSNARCR
jgi:uncharacterized protein YbjQ (UPF0145 family)